LQSQQYYIESFSRVCVCTNDKARTAFAGAVRAAAAAVGAAGATGAGGETAFKREGIATTAAAAAPTCRNLRRSAECRRSPLRRSYECLRSLVSIVTMSRYLLFKQEANG